MPIRINICPNRLNNSSICAQSAHLSHILYFCAYSGILLQASAFTLDGLFKNFP